MNNKLSRALVGLSTTASSPSTRSRALTVSRVSCGVGRVRDRQPNWVASRIIADTGSEADLMIDEDEAAF